jgi:hypothetical protein
MRTHTEFFSFRKLARATGASVIARVAMVCNDLAIANSSMGRYKAVKSNALNHVLQGAQMYFVRVSCGHLNEGVRVIGEVRDDPSLGSLVNRCSLEAQSAFTDLCACLPKGSKHKEFKRFVGWIRNRVAFHYGAKDVDWALEERGNKLNPGSCSMTLGEDIHSCRFEFADAILDTIVCRRLWQIPVEADVRAEADRISDWCFRKSLQFLVFGEDFVRRFLKNYQA